MTDAVRICGDVLGIENRRETFVDNSCLRGIEMIECRHFFVCVVHPFYFFDKPTVSQCIGIEMGLRLSIFAGDDIVFGIQHVEYLLVAFAYLVFDKFLVTAQFGSVVSAYCFVIERCRTVAECICRQVIYPVVWSLSCRITLSAGLFGKTMRVFCILFPNEMFAIEVSFVDRPHIDEAENNQSSNEKVGVQFFAGEEECKESADGDNEYRSPCIAAEDTHAYVFQCSDDSGHLIVLGCLRRKY